MEYVGKTPSPSTEKNISMAQIKFIKTQTTIVLPDGSDLLDFAVNLPIKFGCRQGNCGTCAIRIVSGYENLTQCSPAERVTLQKIGKGQGFRLACQCALNGNIDVVE